MKVQSLHVELESREWMYSQGWDLDLEQVLRVEFVKVGLRTCVSGLAVSTRHAGFVVCV